MWDMSSLGELSGVGARPNRSPSRPNRSPSGDEAKKIDRQFAELLQEIRVGQTGVQLLFGFLLTIPFTNGYSRLSVAVQYTYAVTVVLATLALTCLMSPVLVHRMAFHRRIRPAVIRASHYSAIMGMYLLMGAIVGSVTVVAALAVPGARSASWIIPICVVGLVAFWIVLPLAIREQGNDPGPAASVADDRDGS